MTFIIRAVRPSDAQPLYEMAKLTGGGLTNLQPNKKALAAKLERAAAAFARTTPEISDDLFLFILEDNSTGEVRGTCQIFSMLGERWPFYSYRLGALSQQSEELGRTFKADTLTLSTDLEESSEVGGLFLHPAARAGGLGMLIARSRYLFIRAHRSRFRDRMLAELRGVIDQGGQSPFWDGLAGRFFGMTFKEADEFNSLNGNQFIADLMPKHPIYVAMLSDSARAVIGQPHPTGVPAMRMLQEEGFRYDNYVDIFDGGPTMTAPTDQIRSIKDAKDLKITTISDKIGDHLGGEKKLISIGKLADFRATYGWIEQNSDDIILDKACAEALKINVGDTVSSVARW
jgi:arginine N-succinyltransferase